MAMKTNNNNTMNYSILNYYKPIDSDSGARMASQTADNAQKINTSKKKEKRLGTNGRDPLKERTSTMCKKEEGQSKSHLKQSAEGQSHTFSFRYKNDKLAVACDTSKTVLDALNTNKTFRKIKEDNKEKEIVIQRSKGAVPRAAVKIDFPCCLIKNDEILDIAFIKNNGNVATDKKTTGRRSFSNASENIVTFNVKTKGGKNVKRLMKNNALSLKVDDVCVYAFKVDKLKAALKRDGRFKNVIFKKHCALSEFGNETIHEMSNYVEHLDGKHFEIIVISDNNQPDSLDDFLSDISAEMNEASAADLKENVDPYKQHAITEQEETQKRERVKSTKTSAKYYEINDSEEIREMLNCQLDDILKLLMRREKLKKSPLFQKFFRAEYDKSVQSFSEVYKIKQLMRLSGSVCQIRVEGSARGTGFLLFGRFVLTNAHVVKDILESPDKLSSIKYVEAAFDFERLDSKVKLVPVKKQLPAYGLLTDANKCRLDFALLELDDVDEVTDRPGLLSRYIHGPPPNRGGICIVGHPDGGIKKADPCLIAENVQEAAVKHISENMNVNFIQMITQRSLEDKWDIYENQISYSSCFFHGSSGSPVFDEDCYLIGVHTGGYVYRGEKDKLRSVVEYAYSIQPILDMIRAQAKIKGLHEVVNSLEAYSNKSNESGTAEQDDQTDCEMEDAD
ncbi:serine protease FAM111A-like [Garra rufa]|uniref:serine protease FAM111A-like n=1 Tax=Garra rufa TaxID=137080 RepID=UPI003CCE6D8D